MIYGLVIAGGIVIPLAVFALAGRVDGKRTRRRDDDDGGVPMTMAGGVYTSSDNQAQDEAQCDVEASDSWDSGRDCGSDGGGGDGGGGGD